MTTLNIPIDEKVEKEAEELFSDFGLDIPTAVNIFLRQSIRENCIPFNIEREVPNADTIAAMREAEDMKKAEYMESKIGEEYEGVVSSITQFGMFVELENTVEGLIRFENLGEEYYIYDEERKMLIGEKTNKTYKIGDKVKIKVIGSSKLLRRIDFELI